MSKTSASVSLSTKKLAIVSGSRGAIGHSLWKQ